MQHARAAVFADLHCCDVTATSRVAPQVNDVHKAQEAATQVPGIAEGTPRLTQGMEQAMDVRMADVPDPTVVVTWSEEQLLKLATSLSAMRTIRHQPRGLR